MTETATGVAVTSSKDIWLGSCGSLLPGYEARLISNDGAEITELDKAGELYLKTPSMTAGYLHNEKANAQTFVHGGWLRTGDLAMFRKSPAGIEHMFIVDRIKDVIKVKASCYFGKFTTSADRPKGLQVVPADIEIRVLQCPGVKEVAVVGVDNDMAGELPAAFIVPLEANYDSEALKVLKENVRTHVQDHLEEHNWLKGGIFPVDEIPKSHSGKVLKKELKTALQKRSS